MVMEAEVKDLINEIKELEDRMESMLLNKDSTTIESLKVLYQKEIDRLSSKLIRRRAVLRIISKDWKELRLFSLSYFTCPIRKYIKGG